MSINRRDFLQLSALTGAAMVIPAGLRHARAASRASRGLFVLVQARGGWDPRFVCEPSLDPAHNRAYPALGRVAGLSYAPLAMTPRTTGLAEDSCAELMSADAFFEAHGERLLAINGIETGTLDHAEGARALWPESRSEASLSRRVLELDDDDEAHSRFDDPELADLDQLIRHASLGLTAYEAGFVDALHLELGGFDSHASHDLAQTQQLGKLYRGVDELLAEAARRGLDHELTLLVTSELGRAAAYDGPGRFAGKDHGSRTSALLLGPRVAGGRVLADEGGALRFADVFAMAGRA